MLTQEHREKFEKDGYFIVDDAVEPEMLAPLLAAVKRVKRKVRDGSVDVFTHWATEGEPWAIRGLFSPEFNEPIFAEYLLSNPIMSYVTPMIGNELRLGGVLLFTNPYHEDWGIGWHRDLGNQERDGLYEVEMEILNRPLKGFRWHLALVNDSFLNLVPGSHKRYRTDHERECLLNKEHKQNEIPDAIAVDVKAGQTLFWNGNTIHRGAYKMGAERLTLAGSWSIHNAADEPAPVDERLEWLMDSSVRDFIPEAMHETYDRWRALQLPREAA